MPPGYSRELSHAHTQQYTTTTSRPKCAKGMMQVQRAAPLPVPSNINHDPLNEPGRWAEKTPLLQLQTASAGHSVAAAVRAAGPMQQCRTTPQPSDRATKKGHHVKCSGQLNVYKPQVYHQLHLNQLQSWLGRATCTQSCTGKNHHVGQSRQGL